MPAILSVTTKEYPLFEIQLTTLFLVFALAGRQNHSADLYWCPKESLLLA